MKTYKNLFPHITDFQNLLLAARKAQKNKRFEQATARFNLQIEKELIQLEEELENGTYNPQGYYSFYIYDPKPRMISAAPYRDRVVHHALCHIISPILENSLIDDTFANRKGKGTHAAILRYQHFAKQYKYVLKCDIKKYFASIDHEILKQLLRKKIGCPYTLALIDKIIDNSNAQEPVYDYFPNDDLFTPFERKRGLPIGNLTSQLWGNYYLNGFDHFVKEQLKGKGYVRYVDDFAIFAAEKEKLMLAQKAIQAYLATLRLSLHPFKCHIYPTSEGLPFLGHRVFPFFRLLKKENARRASKRFRRILQNYHKGRISWSEMLTCFQAWIAHANFSYAFRLRNKIFCELWRK
jgi:retron-type reverse transcriptase